MGIALIQDKIAVKTKEDALILHLIIKSHQYKLNLSMADISTLVELNKIGYNKNFFKVCVEKNFYKSEQTVMNAISKMTSMGVLSYEKRGERIINQEFLPAIDSEKVIFKYMIGNL